MRQLRNRTEMGNLKEKPVVIWASLYNIDLNPEFSVCLEQAVENNPRARESGDYLRYDKGD
jgi:hypothetical protein